MKEIKFRAWHKDFKKMYEVKSIQFCNEVDGAIQSVELWLLGKVDFIEDIELMQFTGLQDSEGKDIYEGDILARHSFIPWNKFEGTQGLPPGKEVVFKNGVFGLRYGHIHPIEPFSYIVKTGPIPAVIGNIYENPELRENK